MASIGHPVAGDDVYGPKKVITKLRGQCLHAKVIGFVHPRTEEYMEFNSELPESSVNFCKKFNNKLWDFSQKHLHNTNYCVIIYRHLESVVIR